MTIDILKEAIKNKYVISFEYLKQGKVRGVRIGNPHAVFNMHKKDYSTSIKVHIYQTDGVSDTDEKIPSFRTFDIEHLSNVSIIKPEKTFIPSEDYNPDWKGYNDPICKI
ncbi:hypothetical protein [Vibrio cholerae]|uniref:hypothetical protein n=1 Tax=Vibrio cholerae TaxID=666 RepID=UPI000320C188|nr:hypothetical protein [Vibrio cholerae]EGR1426049.1 hypothetical protein [Vibrio cholerae]EGR4435968.1 hypothetical protein [Vibrio cholerae]EJL6706389.1 hypothetical protein [Vibrio cholerae]EKF9737826.1 hypothetical protein [Vibrio cholerae]